MKSNKVLLGLFVGLMALAGGALNAQNAKDAETPRLYEIGPDNIGGAVSSLVADRQDANNTTLYAGAIGGGLLLGRPDRCAPAGDPDRSAGQSDGFASPSKAA